MRRRRRISPATSPTRSENGGAMRRVAIAVAAAALGCVPVAALAWFGLPRHTAATIHCFQMSQKEELHAEVSIPVHRRGSCPPNTSVRWPRKTMWISSSATCTSRPLATRLRSVASIAGCAIRIPLVQQHQRGSSRRSSRLIHLRHGILGHRADADGQSTRRNPAAQPRARPRRYHESRRSGPRPSANATTSTR